MPRTRPAFPAAPLRVRLLVGGSVVAALVLPVLLDGGGQARTRNPLDCALLEARLSGLAD